MNRSIESGKTYSLKESIAYSEGSTVSKIINKNKNGSTTLFAFDKGQSLSEHTAPFDAVVIVLDGSAEIIIDGKKNIVQEGEMIIMPGTIPHALEAIKPFKMLLIMIKS